MECDTGPGYEWTDPKLLSLAQSITGSAHARIGANLVQYSAEDSQPRRPILGLDISKERFS